jgi:hypothetical protein
MLQPLIRLAYTIAANPMWLSVLAVLLALHSVAFARYRKRYDGLRTFDGWWRGYTPADAAPTLESFASKGKLRDYLRQEIFVDLTFPIVYSLLGAALIAFFARRINGPVWLVLLPFATAIFDYIENAAIITMIRGYAPGRVSYGAPAQIASIATRIKWLFLGASVCALVLLIAAVVVRTMRS